MAARNKPSPFGVASERFATFLRTVPIEITQTVRRHVDTTRYGRAHPSRSGTGFSARPPFQRLFTS